MNNASPAGFLPPRSLPCSRRGWLPTLRSATHGPPGTALSAVLLCDFDALDDGSFLFPTTQTGEALVMRDDFGLLMGLTLAIPAGLLIWAVVVTVLISL